PAHSQAGLVTARTVASGCADSAASIVTWRAQPGRADFAVQREHHVEPGDRETEIQRLAEVIGPPPAGLPQIQRQQVRGDTEIREDDPEHRPRGRDLAPRRPES